MKDILFEEQIVEVINIAPMPSFSKLKTTRYNSVKPCAHVANAFNCCAAQLFIFLPPQSIQRGISFERCIVFHRKASWHQYILDDFEKNNANSIPLKQLKYTVLSETLFPIRHMASNNVVSTSMRRHDVASTLI